MRLVIVVAMLAIIKVLVVADFELLDSVAEFAIAAIITEQVLPSWHLPLVLGVASPSIVIF